jgi:hypothetical protein
VTGTPLHEPDNDEWSLEVVNEGGPVVQLRYLIYGEAGSQEVTIGTLAPGTSAVVQFHEPVGTTVRAVWTRLDAKGRLHVWDNAGGHVRLRKGHEIGLTTALERMYPR